MASVGVLALQGGFAAHRAALEALGHRAVEVRTPEDLEGDESLGGLVLPGGESTAQLRLIESAGLARPLGAFARSGRPVLATCAGLVVAGREVTNPDRPGFGWLDVSVARNAWGRQLDSFEAASDEAGLPLVFIRAPRITRVGPGVEVLASYRGEPVLVREGSVTGATFHPELTRDLRVHRDAFGEV
jgi:5'-phosphate synthase pdxT subunit